MGEKNKMFLQRQRVSQNLIKKSPLTFIQSPPSNGATLWSCVPFSTVKVWPLSKRWTPWCMPKCAVLNQDMQNVLTAFLYFISEKSIYYMNRDLSCLIKSSISTLHELLLKWLNSYTVFFFFCVVKLIDWWIIRMQNSCNYVQCTCWSGTAEQDGNRYDCLASKR